MNLGIDNQLHMNYSNYVRFTIYIKLLYLNWVLFENDDQYIQLLIQQMQFACPQPPW